MSQEKYIGMDVHQATISVAVMDAGGKLIMEGLLETKAGGWATLAGKCNADLSFNIDEVAGGAPLLLFEEWLPLRDSAVAQTFDLAWSGFSKASIGLRAVPWSMQSWNPTLAQKKAQGWGRPAEGNDPRK